MFEGRFKHVHVDREEYLVHLCRYIHLNPVKSGMAKAPNDWRYSDYIAWISSKADGSRVNALVREYFATPSEYEKFVIEYLQEGKSLEQLKKYLLD